MLIYPNIYPSTPSSVLPLQSRLQAKTESSTAGQPSCRRCCCWHITKLYITKAKSFLKKIRGSGTSSASFLFVCSKIRNSLHTHKAAHHFLGGRGNCSSSAKFLCNRERGIDMQKKKMYTLLYHTHPSINKEDDPYRSSSSFLQITRELVGFLPSWMVVVRRHRSTGECGCDGVERRGRYPGLYLPPLRYRPPLLQPPGVDGVGEERAGLAVAHGAGLDVRADLNWFCGVSFLAIGIGLLLPVGRHGVNVTYVFIGGSW